MREIREKVSSTIDGAWYTALNYSLLVMVIVNCTAVYSSVRTTNFTKEIVSVENFAKNRKMDVRRETIFSIPF